MASTVEDRVMAMRFDNKQFQSPAEQTLSLMDKLKQSIANLSGSTAGLGGLNDAARKTNLDPLEGSVNRVSAGFLALATVGITALSRITNSAIDAGTNLAKALFIDAKKAGFEEYELKMGSIQTIMAGSGESLKTVNKALNELNHYADKTIYSFGDMTSNIGKFTNAGVSLKQSVAAIQGVANVAAISGANANEASRAMYNFSQALSIGHVGLMDWKSIELANMGTAEFRLELIKSAEALGTLKKTGDGTWQSLEGGEVTVKNFRNTLQDKWLTSEALTKTLGRYSDETTNIGKRATESATRVKTFSQLLDTMKESAGSGWAMSWELIFGNFNEATKLWTGINNTIGGILDAQAKSRNRLLKEWKKAGGRDALIGSFANVWKALAAIINPIREAFRDIFPRTTGEQIANITKAIERFTAALILSEENQDRLRRTFAGLFAIMKIFTDIIKGVIIYIFGFSDALEGASTGSFLDFLLSITAYIGDALVAFSEFVRKGDAIVEFFRMLSDVRNAVLAPLLQAFGAVFKAMTKLVNGDFNGFFAELRDGAMGLWEGFKNLLGVLGEIPGRIAGLGPIKAIIDGISSAFAKLNFGSGGVQANLFDRMKEAASGLLDIMKQLPSRFMELGPVKAIIEAISKAFAVIGDVLGVDISLDGLKSMVGELKAFSKVGDVFVTVFGAIGLTLKATWDFLKPIIQGIGELIGALHGRFVEFIETADMTDAVSAANVGILFGLYLTFRKFINQMGDVFGGFKELVDSVSGVFKSVSGTIDQLTSTLKTMQQQVKVDMIFKLASAVGILAVSLLILSRIDPKKLGIALGAVATSLVGLTTSIAILMKINPAETANLAAVGTALMSLGGAVLLMSIAVRSFAAINPDKISQGMLNMSLTMAVMVAAVRAMSGVKGVFVAAAGLNLLATAMLAMAVAVKAFSLVNKDDFRQGLGNMGASLLVIAVAMTAMPKKGMVTAATGMAILSVSLLALSVALRSMAKLDGGDTAQALILLGGSLAILAVGMRAMNSAVVGAGVLAVASVSLLLLAKAMKTMGSMSNKELIQMAKSLVIFIGTLGLISAVVSPVLPALAGLAAVLGVLGVAMLAMGVGMALFAGGFATLAAVGAAGTAVLVTSATALLSLLPLFGEQIGLALISFAQVIGDNAPVIVAAVVKLVGSLLDGLSDLMPKLRRLAKELINNLVFVLTKAVPQLAGAGMDMLLGILQGIRDRMQEMVTTGAEIIIEFLKGIEKNDDKVVAQGVRTVKSLARAVISQLGKEAGDMWEAAKAAFMQLLGGIKAALNEAAEWVKNKVSEIANRAKEGLSPGNILKNSLNAVPGGNLISKGIDKVFNRAVMPTTDVDIPVNPVYQPPTDRDAFQEFQKTITGLNRMITDEMDLTPTIAPVLDLSNMNGLNGLFSNMDASLGTTSYRYAASVANQRRELAEAIAEAMDAKETRGGDFIQNNYSPKALSTTEIYRNTNNLFAMAKEALE